MMFHENPSFSICFTNAQSAFDRFLFEKIEHEQQVWNYKEFAILKNIMHLNQLVFLQQIHSNRGKVIDTKKDLIKQKIEGDFLITKLKQIGLCIYTADCLPIIIFDKLNKVIGICHAGWQGSIKYVAKKFVQKMQKTFTTSLDYITVFFGPSAKNCCYEVRENFYKNFRNKKLANLVITKQNNKLLFDLPFFNKLQLEQIGIDRKTVNDMYNKCTICDESFCSYRREGKNAKRQITVVALKDQNYPQTDYVL